MNSNRDRFPLRFFAYLLVSLVLLALIWQAVMRIGPRPILKENCFVEWFEVALLLVVCGALWLHGPGIIYRCLGGLALLAVFREIDSFSEKVLFEDAYKYLLGAGVMVLGIYAARNRLVLWEEWGRFVTRPGFLLMLAGLFVAAGWAQFFGKRSIWRLLQGTNVSESKRWAEEVMELLGYYLILCGVIEERIFRRRSRNQPPARQCASPEQGCRD